MKYKPIYQAMDADLPDPRVSRTQKHLLKDILVIAMLAAIAEPEGWEDIENFSF